MTDASPISNSMQRIYQLVDPGSFAEIDALVEHDCIHFGADRRRVSGDGLVVGHARIDGRPVGIYAHDAAFLGGSSSRMHALKITKILDLALKAGMPVLGLNDSSGIRIHEGVDAGVQFGEVFYKTVRASGVIPQISILLGDCAGGAAYAPALTDFIIMVRDKSTMFLTGPTVIKQATGEIVSKEEIGGPILHAVTTGLAHFLADSVDDALGIARELLSFLPANNCDSQPSSQPADVSGSSAIAKLIPQVATQPYDVLDVIGEIVDDRHFLEVHRLFAPNILTGFARLGGLTIGIVANQPKVLAGCLDVASSEKAARFIRFCDAFSIPILTLLDVPGYLPGLKQEAGGIIGAGAKLLHAYCEATVPKIALVLRKAYGGAHPTLANHWATDLTYALPDAEIAVMGPEAAVAVIFRRQIAEAEDPIAHKARLAAEYRDAHASAAYSARRGYVEALLPPDTIRPTLAASFGLLASKIDGTPRRKHSNIQL